MSTYIHEMMYEEDYWEFSEIYQGPGWNLAIVKIITL